MKIIFLDIDGVLNYVGCKHKIREMYFVDPKKLELLKKIIDETGAKIVLSSTWRIGWIDLKNSEDTVNARDFIALRDVCREKGIEFISHTPNLNTKRGLEIKSWLSRWGGESITEFVILDDDCDMKPFMHKLVRTSFSKGLEQKHVNKAIKILNVKGEK